MIVKYIGISFYDGVEGLTSGKEYKCIAVEGEFLRIIDDSGEDYLYSAISPGALDEPEKRGRWEIVEDTEEGELKKVIAA